MVLSSLGVRHGGFGRDLWGKFVRGGGGGWGVEIQVFLFGGRGRRD